ncbi:endonuclease [Ancylobacter terrae]|uniref:endonuclease n=1 Tax=Ancylobacter sp. sgz301288 TaxID=3342077 RepID=UPI00385C1EF7
MADRAPRICGCGYRIAPGARCPCETRRKAEADKTRPSARERGYDTEYQRAAATFLLSHPVCTCGRPAVLVRHKISIRQRPDLRLEPSNWLPGCRSCNARDVQRERRDKKRASATSWAR